MATHVEKAPVQEVLRDGRPRTAAKQARTRGNPGARGTFFGKSKRFLKHLFTDAINDSITDVGAMMAYYAVLAIFPMIVFIITIAMLVLDHETVMEGVAMATSAMPSSTANLLAQKVTDLMNTASGGFAIGGAALALWGASRGAVALG